MRSPGDKVFEPSCGEADIILAAGKRLKGLGARPHRWGDQLHGIEIFEASAQDAKRLLQEAGFDSNVFVGDFFEHLPDVAYDAVVGNPPFVRYQSFAGNRRARGREAALAQGVRLSGLANAWAAFVVKAAGHLAGDGRLALVLPAELLSVIYAQEVRRFLLRRFAKIRLIAFDERVFPGVLEEVILLLAEGSGGTDCLEVHQTRNVDSLMPVEALNWRHYLTRDDEKWTPALVGDEALAIYEALVEDRCEQLGRWGSAYLGAVTGSNGFFTLTQSEAHGLGLRELDVIRISPPGTRHLRKPTFSNHDWNRLANDGANCLLLSPAGEPSDNALQYIARAETDGVPKAYKCSVRQPWWRVPLVKTPDLFLAYMNQDCPRLVTNSAGVDILNSVYGIRLSPERMQMGRDVLPIACLNSVTLFGAELVGRAYGGGLLKMEPREADRLPVPSFEHLGLIEKPIRNVAPEVERLLLGGDLAAAVQMIDGIVLSNVSVQELCSLKGARNRLLERRRARGRRVGNR